MREDPHFLLKLVYLSSPYILAALLLAGGGLIRLRRKLKKRISRS
jgi:hypothetical protein